MLRLLSVIFCALLASSCTNTNTGALTFETKGHAFAPPAFLVFCSSNQSLCSTSGKSKVMVLDQQRRQELARVNSLVNRQIREQSDGEDQGKADVWRVPVDRGDCEDFALLKKKKLMALGWPASTLLLTVAWYRSDGHTVLTAKTSEGDMILDNRTSNVKNWKRTPYKYYAIQSQSNGRKWDKILKSG